MKTVCVIFLFLVGFASHSLAAPVLPALRMALMPTSQEPVLLRLTDMATAEHNEDLGIVLVERSDLDVIFKEHNLTLSGCVRADDAIAMGQLAGADLFGVIDTDRDGGRTGSFVIFDARTGARLWDQTIKPISFDNSVTAIRNGTRIAAEKANASASNLVSISVLPFQRGSIPADHNNALSAARMVLERELSRNPAIVILERTHLQYVLNERALPVESANSNMLQLAAGTLRLNVTIDRDEDAINSFVMLISVLDGKGKNIKSGEVALPGIDVPAIVSAAQSWLTDAIPSIGSVPETIDANNEADRFAMEAVSLRHEGRSQDALASVESATALNPEGTYVGELLTCRIIEGERLLESPDMTLSDLRHATEMIDDAVHRMRTMDPRTRRKHTELTKALRHAASRVNLMATYDLGVFTEISDLAAEIAAGTNRVKSNERREGGSIAAENYSSPYQAWLNKLIQESRNWLNTRDLNTILLGEIDPLSRTATTFGNFDGNIPIQDQIEFLKASTHPLLQGYGILGSALTGTFIDNTDAEAEVNQAAASLYSGTDVSKEFGTEAPAWAQRLSVDAAMLLATNSADREKRLFRVWESILLQHIVSSDVLNTLVYALDSSIDPHEEASWQLYARFVQQSTCIALTNRSANGFLATAYLLYQKYPQLNADNGRLPWTSVKEISRVNEVESGKLVLYLLAASTLYAIEQEDSGLDSLIRLRICDLGKTNRVTISNYMQIQGDIADVCLYREHVYVATAGSGVIDFPADGSAPRAISGVDGLPRNTISALAAMDGILYIAATPYYSDQDIASYLLKYNIADRGMSLLASTARAEPKNPVDALSGFNVKAMRADAKEGSLWIHLLLLGEKSRDSTYWRMNISTEDFSPVKEHEYFASTKGSEPIGTAGEDVDDCVTRPLNRHGSIGTVVGNQTWLGNPLRRITGNGTSLQVFPQAIEGYTELVPIGTANNGHSIILSRDSSDWTLVLLELDNTITE